MTIYFPNFPGQGWSVHKKPVFSTRIASHSSGREVRNPLYSNTMYQFEVMFDGLDSSGNYPGLISKSLQSLFGLYVAVQGSYGTFVYFDPTDNYAISAPMVAVIDPTTGNPSTTTFQFQRSITNSSTQGLEPVGYVFGLGDNNNGVGLGASFVNPVISVGGTVQTLNTAYTWGAGQYGLPSNTTIVFQSGYLPGTAAVTATFQFGFLCRFSEDNLDFENFMSGLWSIESVKFQSVRTV